MRVPIRRGRPSLLVLGALALVLTATGPSVAAPVPTPTVVLYGDSVLSQGRTYLETNLASHGVNVVFREFPGTALCDWLAKMPGDAATIPNLRAVVMTFVGDTLTRCTRRRGDQVAVYTADANQAGALWQADDVRVAWIAPPGRVGTSGPHPLAAVYQGVAATHGQAYADSGQNLHDASGAWPVKLPCLAFDVQAGACARDGLVQVRTSATDGHLCDVPSGADVCPVYSSGIVRWGRVVVSTTLALIACGPARPPLDDGDTCPAPRPVPRPVPRRSGKHPKHHSSRARHR